MAHAVKPQGAAGETQSRIAQQPVRGTRRRSTGVMARDYAGSFLFVVPYLLFFVAFLFAPLVYAFILSLHNWSTLVGDTGFVGFRHYYNILFNPKSVLFSDFWDGIKHTALFVIVSVPTLVTFALILALLVAESPARGFFRAVYYMPSVLSVTVACTIWLWILQPNGLLNSYLHQHIDWTGSQPWAWISLVVTTLWWTVGFDMVILLAGIIEVPKDYHEAAKIDGANALQRVLFITIPILRPILVFVSIITMLASFGLFGQTLLITRNGPSSSTRPIVQYIYDQAFTANNIATAAAMSFSLGIILMILSVGQFRFFRGSEA